MSTTDSTSLLHYYNRFDPALDYERLLFRAGYVLQGAELNEIQSADLNRLKGLGDAIFKDGDLIRDAQVIVDPDTGVTTCTSGQVYLRGVVRNVAAASLTIPVDQTVAIGLYLINTIVTEMDDPGLRDPASEVRNYQEPGAGRLKATATWGWQGTEATDGVEGEFYPVYTADYGVLRIKTTPPQLDSVSQAIARYDRDSTGGDYVVSGLYVTKLPNAVDGTQQYSIGAGSARVNGFSVDLGSARRVAFAAAPDLRSIVSEPWNSATINAQRVNLARAPVASLVGVQITAQKVATIVHGSFTNSLDPIPDTSIVQIIAVNQGGVPTADLSGFTGGTTYQSGVDYKLTGQKVDWSLAGAEVAIGSTYEVIYRYITAVEPTNVDATGFTVTGAVQGTLILTSYNIELPRIDRLCLTQDGEFQWIIGTATDYNPAAPAVPSLYLPIARVYQNWDATTSIQQDGSRVVPMSDIQTLGTRLDALTDLIAQQILSQNASSRTAAAQKGLFVDPFTNDSLRDAGAAQTAAIIGGDLQLPINGVATRLPNDKALPVVLNSNAAFVLSQPSLTGSTLVNPYLNFAPIPAALQLNPPADHFVNYDTVWEYWPTLYVRFGSGSQQSIGYDYLVNNVGSSASVAQYARQIDVVFTIGGFSPNENLASMTFDGVPVTPVAAV